MSYTPPVWDACDFPLQEYTVTPWDACDFELLRTFAAEYVAATTRIIHRIAIYPGQGVRYVNVVAIYSGMALRKINQLIDYLGKTIRIIHAQATYQAYAVRRISKLASYAGQAIRIIHIWTRRGQERLYPARNIFLSIATRIIEGEHRRLHRVFKRPEEELIIRPIPMPHHRFSQDEHERPSHGGHRR